MLPLQTCGNLSLELLLAEGWQPAVKDGPDVRLRLQQTRDRAGFVRIQRHRLLLDPRPLPEPGSQPRSTRQTPRRRRQHLRRSRTQRRLGTLGEIPRREPLALLDLGDVVRGVLHPLRELLLGEAGLLPQGLQYGPEGLEAVGPL